MECNVKTGDFSTKAGHSRLDGFRERERQDWSLAFRPWREQIS